MKLISTSVTDEEARLVLEKATAAGNNLSGYLRKMLKLPKAKPPGRPALSIPCCKCRKPFPRSKVAAHERKCNG